MLTLQDVLIDGVNIIQYAKNVVIFSSGISIEEMSLLINRQLRLIGEWLVCQKFGVFDCKSEALLLRDKTRGNSSANFDILIDSKITPIVLS